MRTQKITIENGTVSVPQSGIVRMTACEIASLLGVYEQTVRAHIKAILKSGIAVADVSGPATVDGNVIVPDYHGLDMITALAFRVHSPQAKQFREWVIRRITAGHTSPPMLLRLSGGALPN